MEAGLVLLVTLLVVGPNRFPEIAREGGKWYRTARRYANEVMKDVRGAMDELETEIKTQTEDLKEIREIGRDLTTSSDSTLREIREIGTTTRESLEASPSLEVTPAIEVTPSVQTDDGTAAAAARAGNDN